jgi:hypothetical protein
VKRQVVKQSSRAALGEPENVRDRDAVKAALGPSATCCCSSPARGRAVVRERKLPRCPRVLPAASGTVIIALTTVCSADDGNKDYAKPDNKRQESGAAASHRSARSKRTVCTTPSSVRHNDSLQSTSWGCCTWDSQPREVVVPSFTASSGRKSSHVWGRGVADANLRERRPPQCISMPVDVCVRVCACASADASSVNREQCVGTHTHARTHTR